LLARQGTGGGITAASSTSSAALAGRKRPSSSLARFQPESFIFDEYTGQSLYANRPFLYEIVANGTTGIDTDKWDYLGRDSYALGLSVSSKGRHSNLYLIVCCTEHFQLQSAVK
jgi:hypothetical protein